MDHALYSALAARANRRCECGCGAPVPPGEADHFFGRGKVEEQEFNCWILTPACHFAKTNNSPSATHWYLKFIAHCGRLARKAPTSAGADGYATAAAEAQRHLEWRMAKKGMTA